MSDKERTEELVVVDISRYKKVKNALNDSEARYRSLFENMSVGIFRFSADGKILDANPALLKMLGYTASAEVDRKNLGKKNKNILKILREFCNKIESQNEFRSFDLTWRKKDNTPLFIRVNARIVCASDNNVLFYEGTVEDISERKRMESQREAALEALRESEYQYKSLIENIPDIIFTIDLEGKITFVNKRTKEILGFENAEMINMKIFNFIPRKDRQRAMENLQKGMKGEKIKHFQIPIIAKSGERLFFECSFSRVYKDGAVVGAQGTAVDISERKLVESQREAALEALEKSSQLLRDTGEMAKVGGWELDLATQEISWTEETARIHGVEPGYKPKLEEALNFYAPESRPVLEAALKKAAETGEPYDLESLFIPQGSKDRIWVRALGKAVYSGGKIVKLAGTFQNIDKYKRTEAALQVSHEKYRVLFESFPLGISISDKSGKIIEGNRQAEELLGITREAHAQRRIDSKEWQIIQADGTPMPAAEYASTRALRENRLIENIEMGIVKDKGEITWISVTAAPIPLEGYGVAITYGDISERKRAESQREAALKALQAALTGKEVLLKEVHHRVKNNLTAIIGLLQLQRETETDPAAVAQFSELEGRIRSMALVHETLYSSESLTRIELQDYLEALIAKLRAALAPRRDVRIRVAAAGVEMGLDSAIPCGLILNELLTNAFKYAFPGGQPRAGEKACEITIAAEWDGGLYTLTVADNGVGLPADLDWAKTKTLGLRLVRMLGQYQLKGRVELDRSQGTSFRLVFASNQKEKG